MAFTLSPIHAGSWSLGGFKLPDYSITENLANIFGQGRTAQGGSNMFGNQSQTTLVPSGTTSSGSPTFAPLGGSGAYGITQGSASNPANGATAGKVASYSTSQPTSQPTSFNDIYSQYYPGWGFDAAKGDFQGAHGGDINRLLIARGIANADGSLANTGPDYGQINSIFDEINSILGSREQQVRAYQPQYVNEVQSQYAPLEPLIQQGKQNANELAQNQMGQVQTREQNAIADARRLNQELQQSAQQRFGGSSSAGEFSNAILGRDFQRNMGRIQQQSGQDLQALQSKIQDINLGYDQQTAQLKQAQATATAQANSEFQNKLAEIDNLRLANAQNKAQAKLQALVEQRQNLQNIQNTFLQAGLQIKAQAQAAAQNLVAQIAAYKAQANQPYSIPALQASIFPAFGGGSQAAPQVAQGTYNPKYKRDIYGNLIPG